MNSRVTQPDAPPSPFCLCLSLPPLSPFSLPLSFSLSPLYPSTSSNLSLHLPPFGVPSPPLGTGTILLGDTVCSTLQGPSRAHDPSRAHEPLVE